MEENLRAYGTTREVQVTMVDEDGEQVTFKIPNAKTGLTSESEEITTLKADILATPETPDEFKVLVVNNKGQAKIPVEVIIDLVETTVTNLA